MIIGGDPRPCLFCHLHVTAHIRDESRVRPEPHLLTIGHKYQPALPPDPDPNGECRLFVGWCYTHQTQDSMGHHFFIHPEANND